MASNLNRLRNIKSRAQARHRGLIHTLGVALLVASFGLPAQTGTQEDPAKHRYRVELLFFTLKNPGVDEYLGQANAPDTPQNAELLYGQRLAPGPNQTRNGLSPPVESFNETLLPTGGLHLTAARNRLQSSGRYEIEFFVAWNEAFPPGHSTPPLLVRMGDSEGGHSEIEGYIQIERRRYLHVTAQLYDLNLNPLKTAPNNVAEDTLARARAITEERTEESAAESRTDDGPGENTFEQDGRDSQATPPGFRNAKPGPEVVSWMRETRRMRSGEIHFMDSPTMGLLIYFEPLD